MSNVNNNNNYINIISSINPISTNSCQCILNIDGIFTPKIAHQCNILPLPQGWVQGSNLVLCYYNTLETILSNYSANVTANLINEYIGKGYICIYKGYELLYKDIICRITEPPANIERSIFIGTIIDYDDNNTTARDQLIANIDYCEFNDANNTKQIINHYYNNIYDLVMVCKKHNYVMPCRIHSCKEAIAENNIEYKEPSFFYQRRKEFVDQFIIKHNPSKLLLQDICKKPATDRFNYELICYSVGGFIGCEDQTINSIVYKKLLVAEYHDICNKISNDEYDKKIIFSPI